MVPPFAGSDRSSVACMRSAGGGAARANAACTNAACTGAACTGAACANASTATTAPRSSPRYRVGRAIVRWITSGSLESVLERREEGALWERVEEEVLPVQQVVHAERRAPVLVHAKVRLRVHHEPLREPLIRVVAHVRVVERGVELGAVAARERVGEAFVRAVHRR